MVEWKYEANEQLGSSRRGPLMISLASCLIPRRCWSSSARHTVCHDRSSSPAFLVVCYRRKWWANPLRRRSLTRALLIAVRYTEQGERA